VAHTHRREPQPISGNKRRKSMLQFVALLGLLLAAGYYSARIKRLISPEAHMRIAARFVSNDQGKLSLQINRPDGVYAFDGTHRSEGPVLGTNNHVVTRDEVDRWIERSVNAEAVASFGYLFPSVIIDASERKTLTALISEERVLFSVLAGVSYVGGFVLGNGFDTDFDGPKYKQALQNDEMWRRVWSHKMKALQARRNLQELLKDRAALYYGETGPDPELPTIQRQIAAIDSLNPELRQITN
jgi:hypothetical protein